MGWQANHRTPMQLRRGVLVVHHVAGQDVGVALEPLLEFRALLDAGQASIGVHCIGQLRLAMHGVGMQPRTVLRSVTHFIHVHGAIFGNEHWELDAAARAGGLTPPLAMHSMCTNRSEVCGQLHAQ